MVQKAHTLLQFREQVFETEMGFGIFASKIDHFVFKGVFNVEHDTVAAIFAVLDERIVGDGDHLFVLSWREHGFGQGDYVVIFVKHEIFKGLETWK